MEKGRTSARHLCLIAGEVSGDTHGAGLMQALLAAQPPGQALRFSGLGGPQMRALAGESMQDWVQQAAVVGLWEVLKHYGFFKEQMGRITAQILQEQPVAVIFIDYPGFNLRLAQALRDGGYRGKLIYYISPQVWAWKKGRVRTMARLLDLMICIFPFEKALYEHSGLRTVFSGHPMVDRTQQLRQPELVRESDLIGWFPGSRQSEVSRLLPTLLKAAQLLRQQLPQVRFALSAANPALADLMAQIADENGLPEAKDWIQVGTVYQLMQRCQVGAVASGTATLEAACFSLPYTLIYRVNPITYAAAKLVVRIQRIGIINILAQRDIVTELVQSDFTPQRLAAETARLFTDTTARLQLQKDLASTVATLGPGGAYQRAAEAVSSIIAN
jgi:lipid-A-disaccharide synthase